MSIQGLIRDAVHRGDLRYAPPLIRSNQRPRYLFVESELMDTVNRALGESTPKAQRLGQLAANFLRFSSNEDITVGDDPRNKDIGAFMARTEPVQDGIFDIRSRDPRPAIRVFGGFAEKDVFVAVTWKWRKELDDDKKFGRAVLQALGAWNDILPDSKPLYKEDLNDLLGSKFTIV